MRNSSCLLITVLIVISIAACSQQGSINEQYLRSQQYTEFKQRTVQEAHLNSQKPISLESFLRQFKNCPDLPLKPLPTRFDAQQVAKLAQAASDTCSIETDFKKVKVLAESYTANHILRWILLEQKTAYRDQQLVLSTFQDDQLRSFKTVGVFKKNVSERVTSQIEARSESGNIHIRTETSRNIFYPIEQTNVIASLFEVNKLGDISELKKSAIQ